ncbi:uncharacterized protein LOC127874736 [Dreissena polymorpha]|uniref:NACHT domain-containing protein n=1 Tax=Dreissena polymorpha TaxID=45954 RepID=A0A9D4L3T4_DREPO|nr:uncharacterized protein LOC127874736 [Dreissena polymorpha]KAH3851422.1 hypothetical protein DPMN_093903 [Dreissena polymorpha]
MEAKVENTNDVIFIVIQKAFECFKNVFSRFIEKQSKEYYLRCVDSITASFPNYTCDRCGLSSGASNASVYTGNELCCTCKEKLIHLITVEHLSKSTNLSNIKWADIDNISWQLFKFYIDDPGHIDTSSARAAGINALFQICMNHVGIKRVYGDELCLVKEIYDDVLQLRAGNFSEEICQRLIRVIQATCKKFAVRNSEIDLKSQLDLLCSILRHDQHVTYEDELVARMQIIQDLKTQIAIETVIGNCNCNDKLSNLTVSLGIHQRSLKTLTEAINEEFCRVESKLQEEQTVLKNKQDALKKNKDNFNKYMTEVEQFPQQTTVDNNISVNKDLYHSANEKHTFTLVADMHCDMKELINGHDEQRNSILNIKEDIREINRTVVNKIPWIVLPMVRENTELTLKLYPTGCENDEVIANNLITAGQQLLRGEMPTDLHFRQLHHLLQTILECLQDGGNQIRNITRGCVAIHIACPTLTNLIALCEKYLNGSLTELLQPLQDYLRTLPGCKDVIILPIIFERDYSRCIMKIVTQVKIALTKKQISSAEVNLGTLTATEAHDNDNSCTMVRDTDGLEVTKLHHNIKCNLQPREAIEREQFQYFNGERSDIFNESDEQCVDMRNEAYCNVSSGNESPNSQTANTNLIRDMLQNILVPSDIPLARPLGNLDNEIQCNGNRHTGIASKDGEKDETYFNGTVPTYTLNEDKVNNIGTSNVEKRETQCTQSGSNDESCLEKHVHEESDMTIKIGINVIKGNNSNIKHELPAKYHERDFIEASEITEERNHQPDRVSASRDIIKAATSDICCDIEGDTCDGNVNEFDGFEIIQKSSDDYEFIEKDMFTTNEQNFDVKPMCMEQQNEEYERSCEEIRRLLIEHYRQSCVVPVSMLDPDIYVPLERIYVPPSIQELKRGQKDRHGGSEMGTTLRVKTDVSFYRELLHHDGNPVNTIYIQGDPGCGKTTFLTKLVLDWCKAHSENGASTLEKLTSKATTRGMTSNPTYFSDLETLRDWTFLFFVSLRDYSGSMCNVSQMVEDVIKSNKLPWNDSVWEYKCIVLTDAADEWYHPDISIPPLCDSVCKCCKDRSMPLYLQRTNITNIITARPWKLANKSMSDTLTRMFEISGVTNPKTLAENVINVLAEKAFISKNDQQCLVDKGELYMKYSAFMYYIGQQKLDELLLSPMMLSAIVWSYAKRTELKGSKCEIYTILLECLFKKASSKTCEFQQPPFACFTETQYIQPNIEHVNRTADVAFHLLFGCTKHNSMWFSINELEKRMDKREDMEFALKSGILTIRRNASALRPSSQFKFIHMSIQEFLAAYHIARNTNLIDAVISGYLKSQKNAYLDISMVFTFLCGLDISAGNRLSIIMNARVPADVLQSNERKVFQDIILAGYREALENKQTAISLKLSHFFFDEHNINLYSLWINNAPNALSLEVKRELKMLENRRISPASDESAVHMKIDLSSCRKLKSLQLLGNDILLNDSASSATWHLQVWIVLNSGDPVQCTDPFPVLPSIELIILTRVTCSSTWLRSLFNTLLTLDHEVKCELKNCKITSGEEGGVSKSSTDGNVSITTSINKTFAICLDGDIGSGLSEAMKGLIIKSLSLLGRYGRLNVNRVESLSQLLSSLIQMESLSITLEQEDFKVNHEKSLSQSLPSLSHLETLSISVSEDSAGLWETFYCPDIKSLWDSYECLNVNHTALLSKSLSSLTQVDTLSNGVYEDSPCLWEALRGLHIKRLSLLDKLGGLRVNYDESLSKSLSSLKHLEMLGLYVHTYTDLQLPQALKYFNIYCDTLRPSKLSALLNPLLECTRTIEIKLDFGWTSYDGSQLQEYIQIQQELGTRKNVIVRRFQIYDLARDIGCVDGDVDLCFNDNLYTTFAERMDVCKTHRISMRLKICPVSI